MTPFWCGVLHRLADRHEQLQPLAGRQAVVVAVLGDRDALDQLHDEERAAVLGRPGVEDLGDVRVVHQRQRLPLRLEARHHLPAVHPRLDELDGDQALDRLGLLGHPDGAHAALADLFQQLEPAIHQQPGGFGPRHGAVLGRGIDRLAERTDWPFEEIRIVGVGADESFHRRAEASIAVAGPVEVGCPLGRGGELHGACEDLALVHGFSPHLHAPSGAGAPGGFQVLFISRFSHALA